MIIIQPSPVNPEILSEKTILQSCLKKTTLAETEQSASRRRVLRIPLSECNIPEMKPPGTREIKIQKNLMGTSGLFYYLYTLINKGILIRFSYKI